jgi:hypothetical protein
MAKGKWKRSHSPAHETFASLLRSKLGLKLVSNRHDNPQRQKVCGIKPSQRSRISSTVPPENIRSQWVRAAHQMPGGYAKPGIYAALASGRRNSRRRVRPGAT